MKMIMHVTNILKIIEILGGFSARVRSTREGNVYTWECLSVHSGGRGEGGALWTGGPTLDGWGVLGVPKSPGDRAAQRVLATRRAVCLLRSRRRTLFFEKMKAYINGLPLSLLRHGRPLIGIFAPDRLTLVVLNLRVKKKSD